MDIPHSVKRVAVILVLAIIVIFVSKSLLSKAAKNLSVEAERKQQAKAVQEPVITLPESAEQQTSASAVDSTSTVAMEPASAPLSTENSTAI